MGVPDLDRMMDIVQVWNRRRPVPYCVGGDGIGSGVDILSGHVRTDTTEERRKIAVHCHAGLGRTGLAIACFFVFTGIHDAETAVTYTRRYRPGSLQTKAQVWTDGEGMDQWEGFGLIVRSDWISCNATIYHQPGF